MREAAAGEHHEIPSMKEPEHSAGGMLLLLLFYIRVKGKVSVWSTSGHLRRVQRKVARGLSEGASDDDVIKGNGLFGCFSVLILELVELLNTSFGFSAKTQERDPSHYIS